MKFYKFGCVVTVSAYTEIEAASEEEALKIASSRGVVIGGIGSGNMADESWIIDDPDGEPQDIYLEDVEDA